MEENLHRLMSTINEIMKTAKTWVEIIRTGLAPQRIAYFLMYCCGNILSHYETQNLFRGYLQAFRQEDQVCCKADGVKNKIQTISISIFPKFIFPHTFEAFHGFILKQYAIL